MKSCAIIGSTKIAEIHVREFINNGISDITVISRDIKKSQKFSKKLLLKYNYKIKFANLNIISKKKFNLISICSNVKYHLDNLKKIKNKNTKILVEKPLMQLENITDIKKQLDKIYFKYPNLFVSYPMFYLTNFFIKNFKLDKKLNSIYVYYQTTGKKLNHDILFDLAPHVLTLIIKIINKKNINAKNIINNIKKKSFTSIFKISGIKNEIEMLQLKDRKKSVFKFEINQKEIKRITKLEKNSFKNYLVYKNKNKFLKNPMASVIENFIKNNRSNNEYKSNKNLTYQLSYLTKQIYEQCNN